MKTSRADIEPARNAAGIDDAAARRRWLALSVLAVAQFMVFLDETVVNVALPSIKADLGFSQASLAWVVNAYMLSFGGLLLLGGRVADLFGRRLLFLAGIAVFGGASLLDGLAQSAGMLVGARVLQGLGAALATPAALALVTVLFPAGKERAKALGIWGALAGLGFAIGILLGGAITDLASWRWVFLINVPIALGALLVVPRIAAESRVAGRRRFDFAGAATVTAGMTTLVYALLNTSNAGWRSVETYGLLAAAVFLLGAFALIESRSETPLVPAGLVHRRETLAPNVLQLLLGSSLISTLFLLTLYIQQVLGYTPLQAGLAYLPLAGGVAAATAVANQLVPRLGPRPFAAAGLATAAAGLVVLGHAPAAGDYFADVLPGLILVGLGAGLSFVSITTAALARVDDSASGLASGMLSTSVMIGGALGLAVLASVASTRSSDLLRSGSTPLAAQVGGLQLAFLLAAAVAATASLAAVVALPRGSVSDQPFEVAEMSS
ncbi:MAG: DHA2 family efflux MFS transporter permease subunit [Thermoleophilia bacterium]|nr:DHA2 family efflux MFS transporter permease subunit [Thermoleophilia bacterium]MDH4340801.1 DHA2 family efflux MFS transporter permease subunit [Thermoleophilia bacterium]MDH5280120.1 DHA2 family efflux MFS transporter permease subunit [Thermoleophilia bacterium]